MILSFSRSSSLELKFYCMGPDARLKCLFCSTYRSMSKSPIRSHPRSCYCKSFSLLFHCTVLPSSTQASSTERFSIRETRLPMMPLKPFELVDHLIAGRNQHLRMTRWMGARQKQTGEARACNFLLARLRRD